MTGQRGITRGRRVFTAVLVVFVAAKIAGWVSWPWWIVLCPLWLPIAAIPVWVVVLLVARRRR